MRTQISTFQSQFSPFLVYAFILYGWPTIFLENSLLVVDLRKELGITKADSKPPSLALFTMEVDKPRCCHAEARTILPARQRLLINPLIDTCSLPSAYNMLLQQEHCSLCSLEQEPNTAPQSSIPQLRHPSTPPISTSSVLPG